MNETPLLELPIGVGRDLYVVLQYVSGTTYWDRGDMILDWHGN
jgi:hypothetical protein